MKRTKVKINTNDGFILEGIFVSNIIKSSKGIIFVHGITVDKEYEKIFIQAEPRLNKLGFSTLRFDLRCHGSSQGDSVEDFTVGGALKDLNSAVEFMEKKGILKLGLAGASFGGGLSALYAGGHSEQIKALFLANPDLDYDKHFLEPITTWMKKYFTNARERVRENGFIEVSSRKFRVGPNFFKGLADKSPRVVLGQYLGELMIVTGDKDDCIDYQELIEIFEGLTNKNKELKIIVGAEHGFHEEPYQTEVSEELVDFFKKTIS